MPVAPTQERSVDPYSNNRFSSVINRLTRVVTGGKDIIIFPNTSFRIRKSEDPEKQYTNIVISSGVAVKDDVLIHITQEDYELDLTNNDNYVDKDGGMTSAGFYYIVLYYVYATRYPHPNAYYKVIRDISLFDPERHLFLGGIEIIQQDEEYIIDWENSPKYSDPNDLTIRREGFDISVECIDGGVLPL